MNGSSLQPTLSIVIPLYCEGKHLKELISEIRGSVDPLTIPYEIILIDDGSPDNTWAVIGEESVSSPMVRGLRLSRNFGKESAISAGLEAAGGKAVILMDGDLQHPPRLIPEMLRLWREEKPDVVEAVKSDRGKESLVNQIGAKFFYSALKKLSGYDLTNMTDFKLMDARVVKAWLQMGERNLFFRGMSAWLGFKTTQVSFEVPERASGHSSMSLIRLAKLAITAVTSFSSLPLHIVTILGSLFLLFALIIGIQTIYNWLTEGAVEGFATVILLQLIIGSLLMITLGIIGEYIARIYEEVKGRPRYVISETIKKQER